jgi:hypothetical protein
MPIWEEIVSLIMFVEDGQGAINLRAYDARDAISADIGINGI